MTGLRTASVSALGSAIAAIVGLCCTGPLVVDLFGVGGAILASTLRPYRPVLMSASLLLLAAGFWRVHRFPRASTGRSCPAAIGRATSVVLWSAAAVWALAAGIWIVTELGAPP